MSEESQVIAVIQGCEVTRHFGDGVPERVEFTGDMDVDADGANGQHGLAAAYKIDNSGTEDLRNAGYPDHPEWFRSILQCGVNGWPIADERGTFKSMTRYRFGKDHPKEANQFVDAEYFPYIVVPPVVIAKTAGIVIGCLAVVEHMMSGYKVQAVVADVGPRNKIGEGSIELCRQLRIDYDPRKGGEPRKVIRYKIFPGQAAVINGVTFDLQPA